MAEAALEKLWSGTGRFVDRRSGWIVLTTLVVSGIFLLALLTVPSHPTGITYSEDDPAVLAEERIREHMPPTAFSVPFLVSAVDPSQASEGNVLSREVFDEILDREKTLREDPLVEPYVFTHVHPHLQSEVPSIWSLPDTLRAFMDNETPLTYALGWHEDTGGPGVSYDEATDAQWQDALSRLMEFEPREDEHPFRRSVSADLREEQGAWTAKSMFVVASLDHGLVFTDYTDEPPKATTGRPLFEDLEFHVWRHFEAGSTETRWLGLGVGIQNEIESQVAESGRLVAGSFLMIGVLLYLTLRNWRDFLVSYLTLPLIIIWMTGAARLLGLQNNQFTAMLPVLILALGVDFAIHGVRRYREERGAHPPGTAVRRSIARVGPVLVLAAATTATAFLSNAFADVKALVHWGLMGALGIASALLLSGLFAPALRQAWDRHRERRGRPLPRARGGAVARRLKEGTLLGALSEWGARRAVWIVALVALVTLPSVILATGIQSDFNADDMISPDSYLIEGSKRLKTEFPREGEPAVLLIEGDVADPRVLDALHAGFLRYDEMGYRTNQDYSLVRVVQTAMAYPEENQAYYADRDENQIPDRKADIEALLDRAITRGVWAPAPGFQVPTPEILPGVPYPQPLVRDIPEPDPFLVYAPETVQELVHHDGEKYSMTVVHFGIPGTEDFTAVPRSEADLKEAAAGLWGLEGDAVQALTLSGDPYKRYNMVQSVTEALKISITISVIGCFLIVLAALRDLPLAAATTLPVLVLVAWLFAFMVLTDTSLNVVTVTVAAMAIGVGIDYSIHITGRYREELKSGQGPIASVRRAMDSSGVALMGSALTTIAGFLVLTLAPMPLFATFGLITAAMTAASFLAAATLLPPLLVLITKWRERRSH